MGKNEVWHWEIKRHIDGIPEYVVLCECDSPEAVGEVLTILLRHAANSFRSFMITSVMTYSDRDGV